MRSALGLLSLVALVAAAHGCETRDDDPYFVPVTGAGGTGAAGTGFAIAGVTGSAGAPVVHPLEIEAGPIDEALTKVAPTDGCGKDPGQALGAFVRRTVQTMGTKPDDAADSKKGPWTYEREYYVRLPSDYQFGKVLPLVIQAPSCGSTGINVFRLSEPPNTAIPVVDVGVTPPPNDIGHATNPNQGCFDTNDGDRSVDWPFYEALYDKLAAEICFDRNRVFISGHSSGGTFANELACKYAGDAARPIRGVLSSQGALPSDPKVRPACTERPLAGLWVHDEANLTVPIVGAKEAITRAMRVNGCLATRYEDATFAPFVVPRNADTQCKRIRGCPAVAPLVVCFLPTDGRSAHTELVEPAFLRLVDMFQAPPLLTQ